jgi:hypothetical protein
MGCAEEAFTEILRLMHREHIYPSYVEDYVQLENKNDRFQLGNALDDTGCTPKCASHLTFGLETCDLEMCDTCQIIDGISNTYTDFVH